MQPAALITRNKVIRFLTEPRFGVWRNLLAVFIAFEVSFNSSLMTYTGVAEVPAHVVVVQGSCFFLMYLAAVYVNVYHLVPRLLIKDNYLSYIAVMSAMIVAIVIVSMCFEYQMLEYYHSTPGSLSYFGEGRILWLDLLGEFLMTAIAFAAITISILLRQWIFYGNKRGELERVNLEKEAEEIKNRVSPAFLFGMLDRAADQVGSDSAESSGILMKLSRFLRYQLYDSSRETVLLRSEVAFLENYLVLESSRRDHFHFSLSANHTDGRTLVPPMIFFTVVGYALDRIPTDAVDAEFHVRFTEEGRCLILSCSGNVFLGTGRDKTFGVIKTRLEMLYGQACALKRKSTRTGFEINLHIPVR